MNKKILTMFFLSLVVGSVNASGIVSQYGSSSQRASSANAFGYQYGGTPSIAPSGNGSIFQQYGSQRKPTVAPRPTISPSVGRTKTVRLPSLPASSSYAFPYNYNLNYKQDVDFAKKCDEKYRTTNPEPQEMGISNFSNLIAMDSQVSSRLCESEYSELKHIKALEQGYKILLEKKDNYMKKLRDPDAALTLNLNMVDRDVEKMQENILKADQDLSLAKRSHSTNKFCRINGINILHPTFEKRSECYQYMNKDKNFLSYVIDEGNAQWRQVVVDMNASRTHFQEINKSVYGIVNSEQINSEGSASQSFSGQVSSELSSISVSASLLSNLKELLSNEVLLNEKYLASEKRTSQRSLGVSLYNSLIKYNGQSIKNEGSGSALISNLASFCDAFDAKLKVESRYWYDACTQKYSMNMDVKLSVVDRFKRVGAIKSNNSCEDCQIKVGDELSDLIGMGGTGSDNVVNYRFVTLLKIVEWCNNNYRSASIVNTRSYEDTSVNYTRQNYKNLCSRGALLKDYTELSNSGYFHQAKDGMYGVAARAEDQYKPLIEELKKLNNSAKITFLPAYDSDSLCRSFDSQKGLGTGVLNKSCGSGSTEETDLNIFQNRLNKLLTDINNIKTL